MTLTTIPWPIVKYSNVEIYKQQPVLILTEIILYYVVLMLLARGLIIYIKTLIKWKGTRTNEKLLIDDLVSYLFKTLNVNKSRSINFNVDEFILKNKRKKYVLKKNNKLEINCSIMITSAICIAVANILKRENSDVNSSCLVKLEEIIILFENDTKYSISTKVIQSVYLSMVDN